MAKQPVWTTLYILLIIAVMIGLIHYAKEHPYTEEDYQRERQQRETP